MAILGYNVKDTADTSSVDVGRMYASKFTLASAATLTELHALFGYNSASTFDIRLVIYADNGSGSPGARIAYTNVLTVTGSGDHEKFEAGFNVALPAGDYWIGWLGVAFSGGTLTSYAGTGGTHKGRVGGTPNPPPNPFGTTDTSGTRKHSVWAVVGPAAAAPVADFTGTPLAGPAPLSVAFTDASTNTPTSWAWTFGDGGTSIAQNPTHIYAAPGVYTVTLVATNAAGSNTKTRTAYVTVAAESWTHPGLNFIAGAGITIAADENVALDATDVTISASGGASPLSMLALWQGTIPAAPQSGPVWRVPSIQGASVDFAFSYLYMRIESPAPAEMWTEFQIDHGGGFVHQSYLVIPPGGQTIDDSFVLGDGSSGQLLRILFLVIGGATGIPYTVGLEGTEV